MEAQKHLGIYLSKDRATVVCLGSPSRDGKGLGCFSVCLEEQAEQNQQALANLIAQGCAEREWQFSEVAVALDCAMFMQHNMHSEFSNPKQIAATVRFDTEEALATDISDVAIAFRITCSDDSGSELTIFTAQRKILSDILFSLQSSNLDPVSIEPDVNCLSRFIGQNVILLESQPDATLFGLLSSRRGYFVTCSGPQKISTMRTFLVGPTQDRNKLLINQTLITTNLAEAGEPVERLKVFDSTNSVDYQQLSEKLGIEVGIIDLVESVRVEPQVLADCADPVDFTIAYGAALTHLEKAPSINFRNDFMPYQGKKRRLQRALKFASVSFTVLLLALGLYFQTQLLTVNKGRSSLRNKFAQQYLAVMPGETKSPAKFSEAVRKLSSELRRIKNVNFGLFSIKGEESVSLKLTQVLEALNKYTAQTHDLNIDSISVTTKSISIVGDTANAGNTRKLREALKETKLGTLQERLSPKSGRLSFSITIVPGK
ncbi:MAG: hypothetical protein ACE5NM_01465 [Sedimentisphaerales bacterium]